MARKKIDIVIGAQGRDLNKTFVIEEMDASKAEKWAFRTFLGLKMAGVDIPENIARAGVAGVALIGLRALTQMSWEHAEPLLDELFKCVKIRPAPDKNPDYVRDLVENDIEEVVTRLKLRDEVFKLHTNFSPAGILSQLILAMSAETETLNTTQTSPQP